MLRDYFWITKRGYKIVIPSKIGFYTAFTGFNDTEQIKKVHREG